MAAVEEYELPGVGGTGSALRLDFMERGVRLPASYCRRVIRLTCWRRRASARSKCYRRCAALCVLVEAKTVNLNGDELPKDLEANPGALRLLQEVARRDQARFH